MFVIRPLLTFLEYFTPDIHFEPFVLNIYSKLGYITKEFQA